MKHDGLTFNKNRRLGFRPGNPETDVDSDGRPVQSNYVSIVRIKDCRIYERDERKYYDATGAPSIPIGYGGTYYGYGDWKKRKTTMGKWLQDKPGTPIEYVYEYWQCTVYLVRGGTVYTHSLQRINKP